MKKISYPVIFLLLFIFGCRDRSEKGGQVPQNSDSLDIRHQYAESPIITAANSIGMMKLESGFEIKLVASEPLLNSPVTLCFDEKGRLWVTEMQSYMPDTAATGENQPTGKIVILDDTDNDGVMDKRTVFMDSLVLPRGFCLIENGALVAEPPNLWFVPNIDDKAGKKVLVDSSYAKGGNVEHQPNGLLRGLDNWIYNANSPKRYRKQGNKWLIEKTHDRGQWGIAQDDAGRLYYNNNSQNLLGDYFTPAFGSDNENQRRVSGFNEKVVADNSVYPARANMGVNRGYQKDVLDERLRLKNFTAASGPVLYRGSLYSKEYYNNAFVPEPAGNLIKRNIIGDSGYRVSGNQAYQGKEFLASRDERFRPVSMYNGPDGALYVVDMYRGIIQHKTYLTEYLKNEIHLRELTQPLNCGRIYKIVPTGKDPVVFKLPADSTALPALLNHPDSWVREKVQQVIIDKKMVKLAPALRKMQEDSSNTSFGRIHSFWTLEGLGLLRPEDVVSFLKSPARAIRTQGLSAVGFGLSQKTLKIYLPVLDTLLSRRDSLTAPYLAFLSKKITELSPKTGERFMTTLTTLYPKTNYVTDAVINGLQGKEAAWYKKLVDANPDTTVQFVRSLNKVIKDIENKKNSSNMKELDKSFPKGAVVFKTICQTCHGPEGNGVRSLAPPLNKSDWVVGSKDRLIPLVLYGLTGPIQVSGTTYQSPDINGDMPGIGNNSDLKDEDVAQVLSYIRKAWNNKADSVTVKEVAAVRNKYAGRKKVFTMEELRKIK